MTIYLLTFFISSFLLFVSDFLSVRYIRFLVIVIALLMPAILAGMRSLYIGTDVLNYVYPLFNTAINSNSFFDYLSKPAINGGILQTVSSYEIGYTLLTYIIAKATHSFQFLQFIIELFIMLFIYLGINKLRSKPSVWLCMLTYYLLFFNNSLNMVRQWMAMSILLFGFSYIEEKDFWKYTLVVLIAFFFHSTALLGFLFYFIYWLLNKNSNVNVSLAKGSNKISLNSIKFVTILIFSFIFILLFSKISILLNLVGISKFNSYFNGKISFTPSQLILKIPIFLILTLNIKSFKSKTKSYFYLMTSLDILVSQLASLSDYSIRIATYVSMFSIYGYAILSETNNKLKTLGVRTLIIIYLISYWSYVYCVRGNDQTVPYLFFGN